MLACRGSEEILQFLSVFGLDISWQAFKKETGNDW